MRWNSNERYGLTPDQTIDFYKKAIGQISRKTDVNVWDIFEKAYRQCIAEGLEFRRLTEEVVNKWSYWNSEEGRVHAQFNYKANKCYEKHRESFNHYFSNTVGHPRYLINKDDSGYYRFWTLSYRFVAEKIAPERWSFEEKLILAKKALEEESQNETVITRATYEKNRELIDDVLQRKSDLKLKEFIKQHDFSSKEIDSVKRQLSWKNYSIRNNFEDYVKSEWEKNGHKIYSVPYCFLKKRPCGYYTPLNYQSFWDKAFELIAGYDFEIDFEIPRDYEAERLEQIELAEKQRKEHLKEYQKDYFQKNKEAVYAKRKEKGYNENIKNQWADASFKYKNKVCFYEGQYFYFEQLKRKLKSSEKARAFLLPEADQTRKCLYDGQEYEFWMLCYQLRKLKDNPYEVALNSVVKKPNL